MELAASLSRKQWEFCPAIGLWIDFSDAFISGVVQVRHTTDPIGRAGQHGEEVSQILAVPGHLEHRMKPRPRPCSWSGW